jgi:hypothetical protein
VLEVEVSMRRICEGRNGAGLLTCDLAPTNTCEKPPGIAFERHFSAQYVADLWGFSVDKIRELFRDEPGVILEGSQESRYRRGYTNMRISESAIRRVYAKLTSRGN